MTRMLHVPKESIQFHYWSPDYLSLVEFQSWKLFFQNVGRFANVQFANVLRRFANVFSRFANVVKLLKCIELTIYQICLKIFILVVDKRTKNNLYMH